MEPLAEENSKLKEAMKLMEKNVQRAQRERDLAESQARDLEYQKGALSEQLATVSEQLWSMSEQLATISESNKCFRAAGDQVRAAAEHLRAEKRYGGLVNLLLHCCCLIVVDDRYACRARHGAQPVRPSVRSTPGGGEEDDWAGGEAGRGAKR